MSIDNGNREATSISGNNLCFLCGSGDKGQLSGQENGGGFPENCGALHNLKVVLDFLRISTNQQKVGGGDNNRRECEEGKGGGSFDVQLCAKCLVISEKLTDLCEQLELLQLKVNHALEVWSGLIKLEEGKDLKEGQMELIKRAAKEKCLSLIKSTGGPRLVLNRVDNNKTAAPETPDTPEEEDDTLHFSLTDIIRSGLSGPLPKHHKFTAGGSAVPQVAPAEPETWAKPDPPQPTNLKYKCNLCTDLFPNTIKLRHHRVLAHFDTNFNRTCFPTTSRTNFPALCDQLIKKEIGLFRPLKMGYQCPYCNSHVNNFIQARLHLLQRHKQILNQNLTQLHDPQPPPLPPPTSKNEGILTSLTDLLKSTKAEHRPPKKYWTAESQEVGQSLKCEICSKVFQIRYLVDVHQVLEHQANVFEKERLTGISGERFEGFCKEIWDREMGLVKETRDWNKKLVFSCYHCDYFTVSKELMIYHLKANHYDKLREGLKRIQKENGGEEQEGFDGDVTLTGDLDSSFEEENNEVGLGRGRGNGMVIRGQTGDVIRREEDARVRNLEKSWANPFDKL